MINSIKYLIDKSNELDKKISELSQSNSNYEDKTQGIEFVKKLINLEILETKKIVIATFQSKQGSSYYLQNQLEILSPSEQTVKFSLIANNNSIYHSTKNLSAGYNQIYLMKNYLSLSDETISIYLEISPSENSMITLFNESLYIWGLYDNYNQIEYSAIETENNFVLSFINNGLLYYLKSPKQTAAYNYEDFNYCSTAKSHCFVYVSTSNKLFLFRVDQNGSLYFSNFANNNEIFITGQVDFVSASSDGTNILVCYIKNQACYYFEFIDGICSIHTKINQINKQIKRNFCYFNLKNNKYFIILTDINNSNYLIESKYDYKQTGDNLTVNLAISVSSEVTQ